jgi:biofilm PGA synthesis N-glycosyltransferase PgaC
VSVVIPAHAEAETIGRTLDALLGLDYPAYEVIVVNDGSPDGTAEVVRRYLHTGIVRLLDKTVNEGKAMGLNDAIPLCRGEIVVVLDADIVVTPGVLRALVPHFESPRVGAVTGNPRVANRGSLLRNLQTLEFASIVSVQRRAQRVWGRVLTVSGAIAAFRKTALVDAGLFSPDMATEDIDMTWKLQCRFWDVRYEASAVVWMEVPPTLGELWKQRRRWARGLAQVLSNIDVCHSTGASAVSGRCSGKACCPSPGRTRSSRSRRTGWSRTESATRRTDRRRFPTSGAC